MMETVRRTFQLAHVMKGLARDRGRRRSSGPARRTADDPFDERAGPALPRQGHDRAGDHPRHRRPRRLARAGPPRRHRALEAGLLRGQARVRAQGRLSRRGAPLGEGNATRRARRADPLPAGLGRRRAVRRRALSATFVSARGADRTAALRGPARGDRPDRSSPVVGTRGPDPRARWPGTARPPRSRSTRPTAGSRSPAARSRSSRSRDLPLNRRYLLR